MLVQGRILFVVDEPLILLSIRCLLRRESYAQSFCTSSREALAALERDPTQVIISDFRMPEMDGLAFFTEVKKRWPDTTRIILTGYADMELLQPAVTQGLIQRFLFKPVSPATFRHILSREMEVQLQRRAGSTAEDMKSDTLGMGDGHSLSASGSII